MDDKDVRAWRSSFDTTDDLEGEGAGGGGSDRGLSAGIGSPAAPQNDWAAPPRSGLMVDFFARAEQISQATSPPAPSRDHDAPDLNLETSDLAINTDFQKISLSDEGNQRRAQDRASAIKKEKEAAQAELARRRNENQQLKNILNKLNVEYHALRTHYTKLLREQTMKNQEISSEVEAMKFSKRYNGGFKVPGQYRVASSSLLLSEGEVTQNDDSSPDDADRHAGRGSKRSSPSVQQETQNPQPSRGSDQNLEENLRKRAKVWIRTRVEAPKIEDGGRWKKYGQKTAKGNNNPRAYFRCNVADGCPVRKRVQRCAEDSSVLITIYEGGAHNHPLDPVAMAVASATSTAVEMILSGSMTPGRGLRMNPNSIFANATLSETNPFPSVIVDLTGAPNPALLQQQRPTAQAQAAAGLLQVPLASGGGSASLPQVFGQLLLADQGTSSALPSDVVNAATAAIFKDPNFTAAFFAQMNSAMRRQGDGGSEEGRDGNRQ